MAKQNVSSARNRRPVAFRHEVVREKLPLPIVHYPGHYGSFIEFSESEDSDKFMCACSRSAMNAVQIIRLKCVSEGLFNDCVPELDESKFKEQICHVCQRITPSHRWCHQMYGRPFIQDFGWYLTLLRLELGVPKNNLLPDLCPSDILALVQIDPRTHSREQIYLSTTNPALAGAKAKEYQQQERQIERAVENRLRLRMGLPQMGKPSSGERKIHEYLKRIFPAEPIYRCMRPSFLGGLEFDFWLPTIKLAVEYQGEQHFLAIQHWGGEDGLNKLIQRDAKKRAICAVENIHLCLFEYLEDLSEEMVFERIQQTMGS